MATLIKDMPNEPIQYLIRMLQKADQKLRSPRGISVCIFLLFHLFIKRQIPKFFIYFILFSFYLILISNML